MADSPTELTIENSVVVLIDHQPLVAFQLEVDGAVLINNVTAMARAAKAVGVPTVLTTVGAQGSVLADPIFAQIGRRTSAIAVHGSTAASRPACPPSTARCSAC